MSEPLPNSVQEVLDAYLKAQHVETNGLRFSASAGELHCEYQRVEFSLPRPIALSDLHKALSTRLTNHAQPQMVALWDGWSFHASAKELTHSEHDPVELTDKEVALLNLFITQPNESIANHDLLARVWGYSEAIDTNTLETHIYRLRQKLEQIQPDKAKGILTEADGYRWQF